MPRTEHCAVDQCAAVMHKAQRVFVVRLRRITRARFLMMEYCIRWAVHTSRRLLARRNSSSGLSSASESSLLCRRRPAMALRSLWKVPEASLRAGTQPNQRSQQNKHQHVNLADEPAAAGQPSRMPATSSSSGLSSSNRQHQQQQQQQQQLLRRERQEQRNEETSQPLAASQPAARPASQQQPASQQRRGASTAVAGISPYFSRVSIRVATCIVYSDYVAVRYM